MCICVFMCMHLYVCMYVSTDFVVSCIILARLSSNQRDPPSPGLKHGILLSQVHLFVSKFLYAL